MKIPLLLPKKSLGIDVGTSAIKIVELSSLAGKIKLENYGQVSTSAVYQEPFRTFEKTILLLSTKDIAQALKAIFEEAKIKTKKAVFSIPDFASFFTSFELPLMTEEELPQAVKSEARRYIPMPLAEVTIDWQLVNGKSPGKEQAKASILLVAVPNEIINQYQEIAMSLGLEIISLEAEIFSSARALIREGEKGVVGLIDAGARTTTCSIIEKRVVRASYSFDTSGEDLTERITKGFGIDYEAAEYLKRKCGITGQPSRGGKEVREVLIPLVDSIWRESEKIFRNFYLKEKKEVEKIFLAGGIALLPGLLEYFKNCFKKEVEIGNPFQKMSYPSTLEETLKEMRPSYAIAVGLAMRGLE